MEEGKVKQWKIMWKFTYDRCFDEFETWEILGSGPIRFVHGNEYTVIFEAETYFIIHGMFSGKDEWISIDMVLNGWACDIKYADRMEFLNPDKKWIYPDVL